MPHDFKCMKIQMLNSMHAFLTCFEGITPYYHSCPRSMSSWLHSPARRCLVSTMGGCLLPPWRPFVVKFCTAESGTVCTVPALHRRRGLCILLTLSPSFCLLFANLLTVFTLCSSPPLSCRQAVSAPSCHHGNAGAGHN